VRRWPLWRGPYLKLPQDQASLDGLAEPDFVGEEIANAIAGDRPLQSQELASVEGG
jgi:hypothetical protein